MSEQRAAYVYAIQHGERAQPGTSGSPLTFELENHIVELLDGQAILLVDNATMGEDEKVQLDREELCLLYTILRELFLYESESALTE